MNLEWHGTAWTSEWESVEGKRNEVNEIEAIEWGKGTRKKNKRQKQLTFIIIVIIITSTKLPQKKEATECMPSEWHVSCLHFPLSPHLCSKISHLFDIQRQHVWNAIKPKPKIVGNLDDSWNMKAKWCKVRTQYTAHSTQDAHMHKHVQTQGLCRSFVFSYLQSFDVCLRTAVFCINFVSCYFPLVKKRKEAEDGEKIHQQFVFASAVCSLTRLLYCSIIFVGVLNIPCR